MIVVLLSLWGCVNAKAPIPAAPAPSVFSPTEAMLGYCALPPVGEVPDFGALHPASVPVAPGWVYLDADVHVDAAGAIGAAQSPSAFAELFAGMRAREAAEMPFRETMHAMGGGLLGPLGVSSSPPAPETSLQWVIDQQAPMSSIVAALDAAREAGYTEAVMVVRATAIDPPVPDPAYRDAIQERLDARTDAGARMAEMADVIAEIVERCPALAAPMAAVGDSPPHERCMVLAWGIGEALSGCDAAAARQIATVMHLMNVPAPEHRLATITVALDAEGTLVSLPAQAPWAEGSIALSAWDGASVRWRLIE